jgi:hypothetical protein
MVTARRGALGLVMAFALAMGSAAPAWAHHSAADGVAPVGVAADHSFSWTWLDSYTSNKRFFSKAAWSGDGIPPIVVRTAPGRVRPVILQFRQAGTWNTEAIVPTNTSGVALLALDPYCEDGSWCNGLYDYRIKVGSQVVHLVIQYSDDLDGVRAHITSR